MALKVSFRCLKYALILWITWTVIYYFFSNITNSNRTNMFWVVSDKQCDINNVNNVINVSFHLNKHKDKLALIVGNDAFTNLFGSYCYAIFGMQIVKKPLDIASNLWVIDSDQLQQNNNVPPFYTNKEHNYRYNIHLYDYIYHFINRHNINTNQVFKLIDYAMKINVSCIVFITDYISEDEFQPIQAKLTLTNINYIVFKVANVYIENDINCINNHPIALLIHQIMKTQSEMNWQMFIQNKNFNIVYFEDIIKYIITCPFYEHLHNKTFYIKSNKHNYSIKYLSNKIFELLNLNINNSIDNMDNIPINYDITHDYNIWNELYCYFQNEINETSIDNILSIIVSDLEKDNDLISRKNDFQRFDKSAVLCDNRYDEAIVQIVLNFMINLHQSWQFQLFVSKETIDLWQSNKYLLPYIKTEKIILNILGNYYEKDIIEYFSNIQFWKDIKHEKILLFQTDSVLCSKSKYKIEDFLEYDYVGSPWNVKHNDMFNGRVGNGGLSLRTKSFMMKLIEIFPRDKQLKEFKTVNEDQYITSFINLLPGAHLPTYEIAKFFAAETDLYGMYGSNIAAGMHKHYFKTQQEYNAFIYRCSEFNITHKYHPKGQHSKKKKKYRWSNADKELMKNYLDKYPDTYRDKIEEVKGKLEDERTTTAIRAQFAKLKKNQQNNTTTEDNDNTSEDDMDDDYMPPNINYENTNNEPSNSIFKTEVLETFTKLIEYHKLDKNAFQANIFQTKLTDFQQMQWNGNKKQYLKIMQNTDINIFKKVLHELEETYGFMMEKMKMLTIVQQTLVGATKNIDQILKDINNLDKNDIFDDEQCFSKLSGYDNRYFKGIIDAIHAPKMIKIEQNIEINTNTNINNNIDINELKNDVPPQLESVSVKK
eukprot:504835_1